MTAFFLLTDNGVAGPFTGIELRECALAGILQHDGIVGGAKEGPWFRAADIGLFSEKKAPLPHPPDTDVPQYQVRGMPGAFQGPFKLRELIGFAARGMLPAEALLQSDGSDEWIEVRRYRVLAAVLHGELVLIDDSGKIVVRNASAADPEKSNAVDGARAPIELAKSADMQQATSLASEPADGDAPQPSWTPAPMVSIGVEDETPRGPSRLSQRWHTLRQRLPDLQLSIPPRLALQLVCLVLIFAGVASAFTFWKQIGLQREQVIGNWIAYQKSTDADRPAFGISLQQDGQCVIFNVRGDSWSGDFVWDERTDDQRGFEHIAPFSTVFDRISPEHQSGVIEPTDGYIRLQGFVRESPVIDGHPVRDLFLRRQGNQLRIGYLTSVHWTEDAKTMEAGWMVASPQATSRQEMVADLRAVQPEFPVPVEDFGGESPMHISEAIDAVRQGIATKKKSETLHETLVYSTSVDAAYLLGRFGMPDEARRIFRFEVPRLRSGPSFDRSQVIRYGDFKFLLSAGGQLRYLVWEQQESMSS
jgi:hypothetical protein